MKRKSAVDELERRIKFMDFALVFVGVGIVAFTIAMICVYLRTGSEPTVLEGCVFGFAGLECGIMGSIQRTKEKYRERQWQIEDEKAEKKRKAKVENDEKEIDQ